MAHRITIQECGCSTLFETHGAHCQRIIGKNEGGTRMANRMMRWFTWAHLPDHLQPISRLCGHLVEMDDRLPEGAEKTAGLRKLLEAKDCFVRAKLESPPPSASGCSHIPGECAHTLEEVAKGA